MQHNVRDNLLDHAEQLFSEKGFYGTSINSVATGVNLTKQGLLHYFPNKEKLYAAVLERASDCLVDLVLEVKQRRQSPLHQLKAIVLKMNVPDPRLQRVIILLMRELLDNHKRAESAKKWYLRTFLDELVGIVTAGQAVGQFKQVQPWAFVYQLLGAIQYYLVSLPTLQQLYSADEFSALQKEHLSWIESQFSDN